MHFWLSLPTSIEAGALRLIDQNKEVVETDGGYEARNSRWSSPLRSWTISFNNAKVDDADHAAVEEMFRVTNAGTDTFNFYDERTGDTARVRFDGPLQYTNTAGPFHHLDHFNLKEVRDISPTPTALPVITGSLVHGSTLTVSTGTWAGSPTSYTRQWTANGVDIGGATGTTYVTLVGDVGKMIGCTITALDAYGGESTVYAVEVGPIT